MSHVRGVLGLRRTGGLCTPSIREWCRVHDVDLRDFTRNGMEEERALAIGDAFALRVVAYARAQEQGNG